MSSKTCVCELNRTCRDTVFAERPQQPLQLRRSFPSKKRHVPFSSKKRLQLEQQNTPTIGNRPSESIETVLICLKHTKLIRCRRFEVESGVCRPLLGVCDPVRLFLRVKVETVFRRQWRLTVIHLRVLRSFCFGSFDLTLPEKCTSSIRSKRVSLHAAANASLKPHRPVTNEYRCTT